MAVSTQTWLRDVRRMLDEMGVAHRFEYSAKHAKVFIQHKGRTGLIVISLSPSSRKALLRVKTDVKHALGLASAAQVRLR